MDKYSQLASDLTVLVTAFLQSHHLDPSATDEILRESFNDLLSQNDLEQPPYAVLKTPK